MDEVVRHRKQHRDKQLAVHFEDKKQSRLEELTAWKFPALWSRHMTAAPTAAKSFYFIGSFIF